MPRAASFAFSLLALFSPSFTTARHVALSHSPLFDEPQRHCRLVVKPRGSRTRGLFAARLWLLARSSSLSLHSSSLSTCFAWMRRWFDAAGCLQAQDWCSVTSEVLVRWPPLHAAPAKVAPLVVLDLLSPSLSARNLYRRDSATPYSSRLGGYSLVWGQPPRLLRCLSPARHLDKPSSPATTLHTLHKTGHSRTGLRLETHPIAALSDGRKRHPRDHGSFFAALTRETPLALDCRSPAASTRIRRRCG